MTAGTTGRRRAHAEGPNHAHWETLFRAYATDPTSYWAPGASHRQADKLLKRVRRRTEQQGITAEALIDDVMAVARTRAAGGRPLTVFMPNCGSSGSHWLEPMIADHAAYAAGGEIYLPPRIRDEIRALSPTMRTTFVDAVHLLHIGRPVSELLGARLINTAHNVDYPELFHGEACTLVLLRNPVDIVISRTFRKKEFRSTVAPDADDRKYLARNVNVVNRFYSHLAERNWDACVTYESLRSSGVETLDWVMRFLGTPRPREELAETYARYAAGGSSVQRTNIYTGSRAEIPEWAWQEAAAQLSDDARAFGYEY